MKMILFILLLLFIAGFFVIQWANQPENVKALLEVREKVAKENMVKDSSKLVQLTDRNAKLASMQLVIYEEFKKDQFDYLKCTHNNIFTFNDQMAIYSNLVTKGQLANEFFALSTENFKDFVAEIEFEISGEIIKCGIIWDGINNDVNSIFPASYQVFCSGPSTYFLKTNKTFDHLIEGYFSVFRNQKLRVERIGHHLKTSINDKVIFDKQIANAHEGKVGIYIKHSGGDEYPVSIYTKIKSFKVYE